jgi:hypothetical protein
MLGRLARWWRDRQRAVFSFHDGARWRRIDPMAAGREIEDTLGDDWPKLLKLLVAERPYCPPELDTAALRADWARMKQDAARKLSGVACKAFGVQPLGDAGGLTEGERIELVAKFFHWLADRREEARPFPTSPSPTG